MSRDQYVEDCKEEFKDFQAEYKFLMRHVKKFTEININGVIHRINGVPVGTVICFYDKVGDFRVGFSKVRKGERYNRHIGIIRAINDSYNETTRNVPKLLQKVMDRMVEFAQSPKGVSILKGA